MDTDKILKEVKDAIINSTTIHASDEKRVARIFYKEIQNNGWYGMDEVQKVVNSLFGHSEYNKERVLAIAHVIQMLKDRP